MTRRLDSFGALVVVLAIATFLVLTPLAFAKGVPTGDPWKHPGTPPPVTAPVVKPGVPSRELCAPIPILRADGTVGVYADWTLEDYLNPFSVAHTWPLAVYVPGKGLTCDPHGPATGQFFEDIYELHLP